MSRKALRMADRPSKWPAKVRTTMEPDREYEVDAPEWDHLNGMGLLVDEPARKTQVKEGR